jgi:two-component SAPR family response regulator/Tfp pilus assembly protein PilF
VAYRKAEQEVARAYLAAGETLQSLQHFVRADDSESLLAHTPRVVAQLLRSGRWSAAVRLFAQMPPSWLDAYPEFRLLFARALFWSGDSDAALEQVAEQLAVDNEPALVVQGLALRAGALRKKGEYDAALAACNEAMRIGERNSVGDTELLEVRRELGFTLGMQGDLEAAAQHLTKCLTHFEVVQDRENAARIRDGLGVIHGQMGDLASAAAHLRKALGYWDKLDNPAAASNTHNNIGMVLYKRGEGEEARVQFERAVEAARRGGNRHIEGFAEASLGDLDLDQQDFEAASQRFERALAIARELDSGSMASYAQSGLGRAYLGQGQVRKAEVTLAEAAAETRARGGRSELAPMLVLLARARMAVGVNGNIEDLLREAVDLASGGAPEEEARARLWLAEALLRHGTKKLAVEELQRVDAIGEKFPIWEMVEHELPHLARIANYGASRLGAGSHLARLLRVHAASVEATSGIVAASPLEVRLFGEMRVSVNGAVIEGMAWRTRRAKELFAYFLLEGARTRREICLALWPDDDPDAVARTFRVTLHRLRNAIAPVAIELRGDRHQIVSPHSLWCDAIEFRGIVRAARGLQDIERRIELLRQAVALYRGPLAKEFDSDWAEQARNSFEDDYVRCLAELAQYSATHGDQAAAIGFCESILALDPLNDAAAVQLMLSHAALGQSAAVGDTFHRYRRRIHAEGLEPSPAVVRLYKQLLQTSA